MTNSTLGSSVANIPGSVSFPCPKCMQQTIMRTRNEREIVAKYVCTCGFVGPN